MGRNIDRNSVRGQEILKIVEGSEGSYSYGRYIKWSVLAEMLIKKGFTVEEAIVILNSKWTRWAADASGRDYGQCRGKDLERWMDKQPHLYEDLKQMMLETGHE